MKATTEHLQDQTNRRVLTATILHEDAQSPKHAETVIQVLETMIRETANMAVKRWSFHHLERLDVRAMASHQSHDTAVLIVCSHGEKLPECVSTWMERTYQSPHTVKPLIISLHHRECEVSVFTERMASLWNVPRLTDFSYGESSCWEQLRDFIEHRLCLLEHETDEDIDTSEKRPRSLTAPLTKDGMSPADQAIRDRAYQLWVEAGRPDGKANDFWHQAEREITAKHFLKKQKHENHNPSTGRVGNPALERLLKLPSHLVTGPRNAVLQHLARASQKCIGSYTRHLPLAFSHKTYHLP